MEMQIFNPQVLDLIEVALDDLHAKYSGVMKEATISDLNKPEYTELKAKLELCEKTRAQIHQDNNRLKYQQLRETAKNI